MSLIADILMISAALGAAFYCVVLSKRLSKLTNLEDGVGGAISGLSAQVSDMTSTLDRAQDTAKTSSKSLEDSTNRAEAAARRLEFLLASLHDLPSAKPEMQQGSPNPVATVVDETPDIEAHSGTKPETAKGVELNADLKKSTGPTFLRAARFARKSEAS